MAHFGFMVDRICRFPLVAVFLAVLFVGLGQPCAAQQASSSERSLKRLIHPDVAEQIGLDDTQRAKLQTLLQQRTTIEVAKDDPERGAKLAAIDQQIREVLTAEQLEKWESVPVESPLYFQFRDQSWGDVLQWFAEQEGLTLVMNQEPPGTFTYTDTRGYTSAEAIDLLNSVLLTRGFTLVRREKMLTLLQLTNSIPIELIPRVKLEELPSRGKFELISVQFALGNRPIDSVIREVEPYLGTFGRAIPLPQSKQLLVVETAGKMETINVLISTVPETQPPAKPTPPVPPPAPVFAAYSLGELEPAKALETIQKLVGEDGVTVDTKTRLLSAYVIPAKQTAIQEAIAKMQESLGSQPAMTSIAYQLTAGSDEELREQLTALAPQARVGFDAGSQRLLITASPQDHAIIAEALKALGAMPISEEQKGVRSYSLDTAQVTTVSAALQTMLPKAQVVANATLGTIVVRGSETDLATADEVINRWRGRESEASGVLHTFALQRKGTTEWLETVQKIVPQAELWIIDDGKQLVMLGRDEDRQRLDAMLPQLITVLPAPQERQLRTYPLTSRELAAWQQTMTAMSTEFADVQTIVGEKDETGKAELWVWGDEEQQQRIETLLKQVREATPGEQIQWPKIYPLNRRDLSLVQQWLTKEYPGIKVEANVAADTVTVWATQETHGQIEAALPTLAEQLPERALLRWQAYQVQSMTPTELQTLVGPLLTVAASVGGDTGGSPKSVIDTANQRLLVQATEMVHQRIEELVKTLTTPPSPEQEKILLGYRLNHADAVSVKALLDQALPSVTTVADPTGKQFVATGTLAEHGRIKALLMEIDSVDNGAQETEVRGYEVKELDVTNLVTVLQKMWPRMTLAADVRSSSVIATGSRLDHEGLRQAIERLNANQQEEGLRVETYPVPQANLTTLPAVLTQIAPEALVSTDVVNRVVVVWGTNAQHERIAKALEQLQKTVEGQNEVTIYRVPKGQGIPLRTTLLTMFPTISVAIDLTGEQLTVLAPTAMQKQIADVVEKSATAAKETELPQPKRYEVPVSLRTVFTTLLTSNVPTATVVSAATADARGVIVAATASEHERIQSLFDELIQQAGTDKQAIVKAYPLGKIDPTAFQSALTTRAAGAVVIGGTATTNPVVAASEDEHAKIVELVQELTHAYEGVEARELRVYAVRKDLATQAATAIASVVPKATYLPSALNPERLSVLATKQEHEEFAAWLDRLQKEVPEPEARSSRAFPLEFAEPTSAVVVLQRLLPEATFAADTIGRTVSATATEDELKRIESFLQQYDATTVQGAKKTVRAYSLKSEGVAGLQAALQAAFPKATVSSDPTSGSLMVAAEAEQQEEISKLVEELNAAPDRGTVFRAYTLENADPELVSEAVDDAFGFRSGVGVSFDQESSTVFVVGLPRQQEIAQQIVEQMDRVDGQQEKRQLKKFALGGIDGSEVAEAVELLFEKTRPTVDVRFDYLNEQLVVIGTEQQLQQVEETLQQFDPPDRQLEIFSLQENDPAQVREAISTLFEDVAYNEIPSVTTDLDRQQLYVRGTKEQLEEIRQLLRQLGEPMLDGAVRMQRQSSGKRLRTIHVGRGAEQLLKELQEAWPQLQGNPLKVMQWEAPAQGPQEGDQTQSSVPLDQAAAVQLVRSPNPFSEQEASDAEQPQEAPVIVVPGGSRWTLMSEDTEALDALEQWLQAAVMPPVEAAVTTGNHSIYVLQHADASDMERILGSLFRRSDATTGLGRRTATQIVADSRTNALIVNGSRADRQVIEELLSVLDSPEMIDVLQRSLPRVVPVQHTDATRIRTMLQSVYASQLSSAGGRPQLTIPEGVSLEVASLLQQINAASAGPLLTLSVDEVTNSIVMRAPAELSEEVQQFIEQLDEQANRSRTEKVRIIRLKGGSARYLRDALQSVGAEN